MAPVSALAAFPALVLAVFPALAVFVLNVLSKTALRRHPARNRATTPRKPVRDKMSRTNGWKASPDGDLRDQDRLQPRQP